MLHPHDDYPLHQTPEPMLQVGTESANAYDRFFFNGYDADGETFFALALGVYPNRLVMDAAFSVIRDGVQHNVRASRRCPDDRTQTEVGPITVEILEPMTSYRLTVRDEHGISAELTATAIAPAIEEPRFVHHVGARVIFDYTRLTQFISWSGWIDVDGERVELRSDVVGVRDRSWGVRPVGESRPGPASAPQFFWIWVPTIFEDRATHVAINHEADGRPWHESGAVVPRLRAGEPTLDPGRVQRAQSVELDLDWEPGTRWLRTLGATISAWGAEDNTVTYEPFLNFHMSGIGYRHPEWGHGMWRGELDSTRDAIVLDEVSPTDPTMIHIQALSRARLGDRTGVGVIEQLIIGPHEPSGITGVIDGYEPDI